MADTLTAPSSIPVAGILLQEAERLQPLIREDAAAIEDRRRLTPRVHDAILAAGFYRMTMPRRFGEPEVTLAEVMRILETLAVADASTAWSVWAGLGAPAESAFIEEEGTIEMFSAPDACVVGSIGAMGRAVAVAGGYRVTGRWPFASGIHQATHAGGLCIVHDGAAPRVGPDGEPAMVFCYWPVAGCQIIDTWDTTGLRGTGSDDIAVEDLFVPAHMVADFSREPRPGLSPVHYIHVDNAANVTCAVMAIGIARAAIQAFQELGPKKKVSPAETLAESALGRIALAKAETRLAQARGHLYETAEMMDEEMAEGVYPGKEWFARTSLASVAAVDAAIEVVTSLYRAAGSSAVRRSAAFDRRLRDVFTLAAHKTVQHVNLVLYGGEGFVSDSD
jgi:alkylation response protein AidB-like acyl-CoA dehydrogenase